MSTTVESTTATEADGVSWDEEPFVPRRPPLIVRLTPYLLLLLPVTLILVTQGYPMTRQFVMSFQEFGLAQQFGQAPEWVGLDNYIDVLTDPYFWTVTGRSIAFMLITASVTMVIGVGFAILMNHIGRIARTVLQIALVLAWAMPVVAALQVWQLLFESRHGLVNWMLTSVGLAGFQDYNWLGSTLSFFAVASIVVTWVSVPLVTLTSYAALTQVDEEINEAAALDGANLWRRLRHITLPLIKPVLTLMLVMQVIWDLRVFTQVKVLQTASGNVTDTNLLGTYVYNTGISGGDYGMASALATLMLVLLLVLTAYYIRVLHKQGQE